MTEYGAYICLLYSWIFGGQRNVSDRDWEIMLYISIQNVFLIYLCATQIDSTNILKNEILMIRLFESFQWNLSVLLDFIRCS